MGTLVSAMLGYLLRGTTSGEGLNEVIESARAVASSQEVDNVVQSARLHASSVIRAVAEKLAEPGGHLAEPAEWERWPEI